METIIIFRRISGMDLKKLVMETVDVAGSISMVALGVLLGNKIYDMKKENAEYNSKKE